MQLVQVHLLHCLCLTAYELLLSWLFFLLFLSIAKFCGLNVLVNLRIEVLLQGLRKFSSFKSEISYLKNPLGLSG